MTKYQSDITQPEGDACAEQGTDKRHQADLSRRQFLARSALVSAAVAAAPALVAPRQAHAGILPAVMISDTLNAVLAFVVPGGDPFSVQQQLTDEQPGGVEANAQLPLEFGLNTAGLAPPPFDSLSELITFALDNVTGFINPDVTGPFNARFANLSWNEKVAVFSAMESGLAGAELITLANALLLYSGLMAYSEAGVLNPLTGELLAHPVGWSISGYGGISVGHKDYQGYYRGRRHARER
ncbi:MAG: twin-arginine translocation signal domain-containing protein [Pseudomonadales bacterium]|nr:twin-arginine translocation signal domain-containing protein [Pseudomonadales bacterium]MED5431369.1 twin-arginine translocation signal domain-containing protein [Pseudomonadota bacterium]MEE2870412.1 twin-arginine translocation signal domain-containing protein [Pseudomonadota bacterium]